MRMEIDRLSYGFSSSLRLESRDRFRNSRVVVNRPVSLASISE